MPFCTETGSSKRITSYRLSEMSSSTSQSVLNVTAGRVHKDTRWLGGVLQMTEMYKENNRLVCELVNLYKQNSCLKDVRALRVRCKIIFVYIHHAWGA